MLPTVKYSRIPTEEYSADEERISFDYGSSTDFSSSFSYGSNSKFGSLGGDFKSAFSYSKIDNEKTVSTSHQRTQASFGIRCIEIVITATCYVLLVAVAPLSFIFCLKKLKQYERAVVYRLGHLKAPPKGPGYIVIFPLIDRWSKVDLRVRAFNIPPQQVLTDDEGIIEVGADVYFRISDALLSTYTVQDLNHSTRVLAQTTLTSILQKKSVVDIEREKTLVAQKLIEEVNKLTQAWGVEIGRTELSHVKIIKEPPPAHQKLVSLFQDLIGSGSSSPMTSLLTELAEKPKNFQTAASNSLHSDVSVPLVTTAAPEVTPEQLLQIIKHHLTAELVSAINTTYQFNVSGTNGGTFYLDLKYGSGDAGAGPLRTGNPDVTFQLTQDDLRQMLMGLMKPIDAYMNGRLNIVGNLQDAVRLKTLLDAITSK